MTIFEYVKEASSITLGTFFEHIQAITGTGVSETVYIHAETMSVDLIDVEFVADLDIILLSVDLTIDSFDVDLVEDDFSADINMEVYNGN